MFCNVHCASQQAWEVFHIDRAARSQVLPLTPYLQASGIETVRALAVTVARILRRLESLALWRRHIWERYLISHPGR